MEEYIENNLGYSAKRISDIKSIFSLKNVGEAKQSRGNRCLEAAQTLEREISRLQSVVEEMREVYKRKGKKEEKAAR